jgi:hypothetical protein
MDESSASLVNLEVVFERMCVSPKEFFGPNPSRTGDWPLLSKDNDILVWNIVRLLAFNLQHAHRVFWALDCKASKVLPERRKSQSVYSRYANNLG